MSPNRPESGTPRKLRIQSIFFENGERSLEKMFCCLESLKAPPGVGLELVTGDCSSAEVVSQPFSRRWVSRLQDRGIAWRHEFFNSNLGFGAANNRLMSADSCDLLLLLNPDGVFAFDLLERLVSFADSRPGFGAVEARQIPLEHPKSFHLGTGETNWVSCSCVLLDASCYRAVGGFDEAFFLYCEDVDLSWRIAASGRKLFYCADAFFCHRKRLDRSGVEASPAESYYGTLGALMIYAKYGRRDLMEQLRRRIQASPLEEHARAIRDFAEAARRLRPATAPERRAAWFTSNGAFGERRWEYEPVRDPDVL